MRIWLMSLALLLLFITSIYISYNIGITKGKMLHIEEQTITDVAKKYKENKKTENIEDLNVSKFKDDLTKQANEAKQFVLVTFNNNVEKAKKYYVDLVKKENNTSKLEDNNDTDKIFGKTVSFFVGTKNFFIDTYEKGVEGFKQLYEKFEKSEK